MMEKHGNILMCKNIYAPLHNHSFQSNLDGLPSPLDIVKRAKEINSPALAITDHGNISCIIQFQKACKKYGIKCIPGIELYQSKHHPSQRDKDNAKHFHLTLLAKNQDGVKDLFRLVSESNRPDYFYRKPRLNLDIISEINKNQNFICLSGCLIGELSHSLFEDHKQAIVVGEKTNSKSEVQKFLKHNWRDVAQEIIDKYIKVFGKNNYYLELQSEGMPSQDIVVDCLRETASALGIASVCSLDTHYCRKQDAIDHRILLCSQMHTNLDEQERLKESGADTMAFFSRDTFYMFNYSEMREYYTEKELETTLEVADKIDEFNIFSKPFLPKFNSDDNKDSNEILYDLCIVRAKEKLGNLDNNKKLEYWQRLEKELKTIQGAELADYFLIVYDACKFVDDNNAPRGKGRGSGAGSLVNYLLGITQIDPLEYGLYFERFYNQGRNLPQRVSFEEFPFDDFTFNCENDE